MRWARAAVMTALLLGAPVGYANIVLTGVTVTPNPIGAGDTVTISVSGHVNTVPNGQANCTGVEIFFGDIVTYASTDPYKPAGAFVRLQPTSNGSFRSTWTISTQAPDRSPSLPAQ